MKGLKCVIFGASLMIIGILGIISFGLDYSFSRLASLAFNANSNVCDLFTRLCGFLSVANILGGFILSIYGIFSKHE